MSDALAAERCEQRGCERAALLDATGALDAFAEAEARWSRAGATDGVCRVWVRAATLHLRGLGDLHGAALWLEQARRARGPRGSEAWASATLARADLLFLRGNAARAASLVDAVVRHGPPGALIAAAIQGIAVTRGSAQDRFAELLCTRLEAVPPPDRLARLERLDICPSLSGSPELRTRLRALIPPPVFAPERYPPGDRARLAVRDAELDRVLGRLEDAVLKLEHAWRKLGPAPDLAGAASRAGARRLAEALANETLGEPRAIAANGGAVAVVPPATRTRTVADAVALVRLAAVLDDADLRERVLEAAGHGLDAAGAWPARLLELRAREAASAELALEYRRRAAGIFEAVGDEARRDRALGRSPSRRSSAGAPELSVLIRLHSGRLTLIARDHAGRTGVLRDAIDPAAPARELAKILRDAVAGIAGDHGGDVALLAPHPIVAALPWELAAPVLEAAGLRLFRRTRRLGDDARALHGALRRCSTASLARFQAEHGMPATGLADPLTVQRLHQTVAGGRAPRVAIVGPAPDAEAAYARAGFQLAHATPVAVLHIHASLIDHHGTPALDLPETPATALALDRTLPRDLPAPLVVLHTPDVALRNVIATQLAAAGTARAILATSAGEAVATALQDGDIYDVTRAVRAHDAHTALFTRGPSIRFPKPG